MNQTILKICTKCGKPKSVGQFYWRDKSTGLRRSDCKECVNQHSKQYYIKNKKKIIECVKQYYTSNKKSVLESRRLWRKNNKEKISECDKKYRENNKEKISIHAKKYYQENKERIKYNVNIYHENNKESVAKCDKCYRTKNKKYLKEYQKQYRKNNKSIINKRLRNRRNTDPMFKLRHYISVQIRTALKDGKSGRYWEDLVGYNVMDLKLHLEKQFKPNMSWKNYGKWHIDHCRPVSWFKKTEKELLKAWELSNLQPMWANKNLIKGNRWESPRIITATK